MALRHSGVRTRIARVPRSAPVTASIATGLMFLPVFVKWLSYDMRLMMSGIQRIGMRGATGAVERLQSILGRPLRTYANTMRKTTGSMLRSRRVTTFAVVAI